MRIASTPQSAIRRLRPFHHVDLRDIAANVRCPTLVFHSRHDARIPFEQGRTLAAHIPGARFVALDSRNHWVVETEPAWAQFTAEIDGFLPSVPHPPAKAGVLEALTPRELQVIELLAAGLDNSTIGRRLGISAKTARNRVSLIFDKIGASRPAAGHRVGPRRRVRPQLNPRIGRLRLLWDFTRPRPLTRAAEPSGFLRVSLRATPGVLSARAMQQSDRLSESLTEEGRYRLLVGAITDYAIYMLDPTGIVTSWNPGAQRFKGYARRRDHRPALLPLLHRGGPRSRAARRGRSRPPRAKASSRAKAGACARTAPASGPTSSSIRSAIRRARSSASPRSRAT